MTIRILLADDSQQYRSVIRAMLDRESDMRVVAEAGDGHAALQEAFAQTPDLVLIDVDMPQMDGIEAARRLVSEQFAGHVLALSLHPDAQFVQAMIAAGAKGYVLKDDPFPELLTAIRQVAAGRTYFSSGLAPRSDAPDSDSDTRSRDPGPEVS
jgi:DNA-binding NarL/FixJ family response regulator